MLFHTLLFGGFVRHPQIELFLTEDLIFEHLGFSNHLHGEAVSPHVSKEKT